MKIKVLQLNAWYGRIPDLENLLDFLEKENADIITLQEIHDGHGAIPRNFKLLSELKSSLPNYAADYGSAFCDITPVGNIESGNATFVKGKILKSNNVFFDYPYSTFDNEGRSDWEKNPQTVLVSSVEIKNTPVTVMNVHGIWGTHGRDSERRLKMVDTILENIKEKENVILAGDFNLNPDTEAVKKIEEKLKSVFGESLVSTFNTRRKQTEWAKNAVVDMMFVSPSIKIISKACPDVDVSDHLPLVVELEIED